MKLTFISDRCTALEELDDETAKLIYNKMAHVIANFSRIIQVAQDQARNDREREVANEGWQGIDEIQCDLDNAYDEFYFARNNEYLPNEICHIEVVTPLVAEENDREWLSDRAYTDQDRASYKLGEVMSDYSKLDDKYYFKFM